MATPITGSNLLRLAFPPSRMSALRQKRKFGGAIEISG
jgi:hypothetical protein